MACAMSSIPGFASAKAARAGDTLLAPPLNRSVPAGGLARGPGAASPSLAPHSSAVINPCGKLGRPRKALSEMHADKTNNACPSIAPFERVITRRIGRRGIRSRARLARHRR